MCGQGWAAHFSTDFIKTGLNMSPSITYNAGASILRFFKKQAYTEQNPKVPEKWTILRKLNKASELTVVFRTYSQEFHAHNIL